MKRTKGRLAFCLLLLALMLAFIWGNSLLDATASRSFSDWIRAILRQLLGKEPSGGGEGGSRLLRKVAHFTEFCCLGLCLAWLMHMLRSKISEAILLAAVSGVAVACIDECIQLFIPGRGPGIVDVLIDSGGLLLGIGLLSAIPMSKHGKTKSLEEQKL